MSAFAPAETLREYRPLLLAMEAIGWFHMAGKARSEFLRHHGGDRVDYRYEKWHDHETPPFPWDDLLGWVRSRFQSKVPSNAWPGSFQEFTEKHTKTGSWAAGAPSGKSWNRLGRGEESSTGNL